MANGAHPGVQMGHLQGSWERDSIILAVALLGTPTQASLRIPLAVASSQGAISSAQLRGGAFRCLLILRFSKEFMEMIEVACYKHRSPPLPGKFYVK